MLSIKKTIANIIKFINLFGKTLWTGTWNSGTRTIPGIGNYSLLLVVMNNVPLPAYSDGSRVRFFGTTGTTSHSTYTGSFTFNGDTCTYIAGTSMVHNPSGNHGGISTGQTISKIVGLCPYLE